MLRFSGMVQAPDLHSLVELTGVQGNVLYFNKVTDVRVEVKSTVSGKDIDRLKQMGYIEQGSAIKLVPTLDKRLAQEEFVTFHEGYEIDWVVNPMQYNFATGLYYPSDRLPRSDPKENASLRQHVMLQCLINRLDKDKMSKMALSYQFTSKDILCTFIGTFIYKDGTIEDWLKTCDKREVKIKFSNQ